MLNLFDILLCFLCNFYSLLTAYQILMSKSCFYNSAIDISRKIWYNKLNRQPVLCIKKEVKQNECNHAQNRRGHPRKQQNHLPTNQSFRNIHTRRSFPRSFGIVAPFCRAYHSKRICKRRRYWRYAWQYKSCSYLSLQDSLHL